MLTTSPHRFRDPDGLCRDTGDVQVPILVIEYAKEEVGWVPFSVQTPWSTWDVDWCNRDQRCCFHVVGSGLWVPWREIHRGRSTEYLGHGREKSMTLSDPSHPSRVEWIGRVSTDGQYRHGPVWVNPEFVDVTDTHGTEFIIEPLELIGGVKNPFEMNDYLSFEDVGVVYCCVCGDRMPTDCDPPCEHLEWCDACCAYTGSGSDGDCTCAVLAQAGPGIADARGDRRHQPVGG